MAKQDMIEVDGVVAEILPGGQFRVQLDDLAEVLVYTAGKMRKNRIRTTVGDRVTVVYDWDSLDTQPETRIVGSAMASFTYTEELEVASLWPSPAESLAFLADYEAARGEPLTERERRGACGAAVYLGAYVARCSWAYARVDHREPLEALANALL